MESPGAGIYVYIYPIIGVELRIVMYGWMDGRIDGWVGGWCVGWMDGLTVRGMEEGEYIYRLEEVEGEGEGEFGDVDEDEDENEDKEARW